MSWGLQQHYTKQIHQPLGPLEIEAQAMEESYIFAWDVRIRDVIFEGN